MHINDELHQWTYWESKVDIAFITQGEIGACLIIIAHRIGTSKILPWDRNSYLTHVILPRLSCEGCKLVVLELMHMVIHGHPVTSLFC